MFSPPFRDLKIETSFYFQIGKINFSLQAIADLAGMTVSSVYGVVGLVSKKNISRSVVDFLKKEDFADGVSVKKAKSGYEVSLYVVLGNEVKIAEVVFEIQKQVSYVLEKNFGMPFQLINVFVQRVA